MANNNRISVVVDISAEASNLTQIINQSKKSLQTLAPNMDPKQAAAFGRQFDNLQNKIDTFKSKLAGGLNSQQAFTKASQDVRKFGDEYNGIIQKIQSLGIDPAKIVPNSAEIKPYTDKLADLMEKQAKVAGERYGKGITDSLNREMKKAAKAGDAKEVEKIGAKASADLAQRKSGLIDKYKEASQFYGTEDPKKAASKIKKEIALQEKLYDDGRGRKAQQEEAGKYGKNLTQLRTDLKTMESYGQYEQDQAAIQKNTQQYAQQATTLNTLQIEIDETTGKINIMAKSARDDTANALNQMGNSTQQAEGQLGSMNKKLDEGANKMGQMVTKAKSMSQLKSYFSYFFSVGTIINYVSRAIRGMINDFKELDKQFNEISIVTGKTMKEMWNTFSSVNKLAQEYGVNTKDVVSVQKLYYQQGRKTAEVNDLTRETLKFAKISGLEFGEATEYMTATLNAYNMSAEESVRITDTFSALAANAAADASEISVAMSKVASLSALSGSTMEETAAYLTKIIETTREGAETAGTALKTIEARFTAINKLSKEQEELLEADYNFNSIEKALRTVGVAVKDSTGNIRGFSEILDDLGPKWDELSSNQQHYIATQAAGARQQSRFIALMNDWGRTAELVGVANESAGTGNRQLALSLDSIETELNKLKANWQEFYTSLMQSSWVKAIVRALNSLLEVLTKIASLDFGWAILLGLGLILKGIIRTAKAAGIAFVKGFTTSFTAARKPVEAAEDAEGVTRHYSKGFREGQAYARGYNIGSGGKGGKVAMGPQPYMGQNLVGYKGATTAATGTGVVAGAGKAGSTVGAGAGKAAGGIAGAMGGALGVVAIVVAIVLAIAALFTLLDRWQDSIINERYKKKAEEIIEANNKVTDAINNTKKVTSDYTKALKLHQKGLLRTSDETEEYQEALRGLQEEIPQMVQTLEDGTLKLNTTSAAYGQYLERQEKIIAKYNSAYYGADRVVGEGVLLSSEGQQAQKNIQNIASSISGMDEDSLKTLGLTGITSEELGKLAETGLTRETVNEILNEWNQGDYDAQEFNELLKRYQETGKVGNGDFAWESYDTGWNWLLGIPGLFGAEDKQQDFQNLLDTLNELAGYDVVSELVQANDPDAIRKVQVTNWTDMYDAQKGTNTSDYTETAFSNVLKRANFETNKFDMNEFYQFAKDSDLSSSTMNAIFGEGYITPNDDKVSEAVSYEILFDDNSGASYKQTFGGYFKGVDFFDSDGREKIQNLRTDFGHVDSDLASLAKFFEEKGLTITNYDELMSGVEEYQKTYDGTAFNLLDDTVQLLTNFKEGLVEGAQNYIERYYKQNTQASLNNIEQMYARLTSTAKIEELSKLSTSDITEDMIEKLGFQEINEETLAVINAAIDEAWKEVEEKRDDFKNTLKAATGQDPGDLLGFSVEQLEAYVPQVKRVAAEYGVTAASKFWEAYKEYNTSKLNELPSEFRSAFAQVDFNDAASIASYAAKLSASFENGVQYAQDFFNVVSKGVNIADVTLKDAANQITDLSAGLEKVKKLIEGINDVNSAISLENAAELVTKAGLKASDFTVSAEGLQLTEEKRIEAMQTILRLKGYELLYQQQLYQLALDELDVNHDEIKEYTELITRQAQGGELTEDEKNKITDFEEEMAADPSLAQAQAKWQTVAAGKEILDLSIKEFQSLGYIEETQEKVIDKLEKILDLLAKIQEYADVDFLIANLEHELDQHKFDIEFSTNTDTIVEATKDSIDTINNLISANMAKSQHARRNVDNMKENLLAEWGKYISFDGDNILTDEKKLANWAEDIGNMDASTDEGKLRQEAAEAQFETLMEQIDAYKEEYKIIQDCEKAVNGYKNELEDMFNSMRQNVVDMEDKFIDLFIQRDEEALEALEKRYDKMKEMDDDYLDSVRDAIEEERRLRDQNKAYDDVAQMERKLALLQMGGGSAVEIQKLQKEIQDARQDIADTEQDNILDGIEKENEARAAAMDEEVTYQQAVLEQKKEDRRLYNEEVKALMAQDKETILDTWKELDKEWLAASETNKALLESEMNKLVTTGQASATLLADTEIKKIEDAFMKVKTAGVDEADQATKNYVNTIVTTSGGAVSGIDAIEQAYIGVESVVDRLIEKQGDLLNAKQINELKKILYDTDFEMPKIPDLNIKPKGEKGEYKETGKITAAAKIGENEWIFELDNSGNFYTAEDLGVDTSNFDDDNDYYNLANKKKEVKYSSTTAPNFIKEKSDVLKASDNSDWSEGWITTNNTSIEDAFGYTLPDEEFTILGYVNELIDEKRLYLTSLFDEEDYCIYIDQTDLNELLGFDTNTQLYKLYDMPGFSKKDMPKNRYSKTYPRSTPAYASGGMVDFTGPAWVDGTKTRPEAFLSANDTQLIASLRDILRAGVSPSAFAATSLQKSGDTYYTIHINVDELGDGYSVDDLVEEMEERILQATGNTNVVKLTR